jgi:P-type conjugative transfer protein TrbG
MRTAILLIVSTLLLGCQPQPQVADLPEPPAPMVQACPEVAPRIIEVPVPVPMACQWQPEPASTPTRRNGKRKGQPVSSRSGEQRGFNSVQTYTYMEGALYQAAVAVNTATTILLQPGEYFSQAVIGDKAKWSTSEVTAGSRTGERGGVVVNCTEVGARSNLMIAASKRVYLLELRCNASTYHAQISWTYPEDNGPGVLTGQKPVVHPVTQPVAPVTADAPSGATYTLKSNREVAWMPTHVYDTGVQGKQTVIVFPPALGTTDAPVLYVRTPEKTQAVTNYRVRQGFWVNDRIFPAEGLQATLNLGEPVTYYLLDQIAEQLELRVGERKPTVVTITRQAPGA